MRQHDDGSYLFSPTDLVGFLGCYHATVLDLKSFSGQLPRDEVSDSDHLLRQKGLEHEAAYLQSLKVQGMRVAEIPIKLPIDERVRQTAAALKSGVDVVYQAALLNGRWGGYADFLIRTEKPSGLGVFSYEVTDTKLARHPDPKHLIQLCVYSDLLTSVQGVRPTHTHLVLGDGQRVGFLVEDFAAYVRHARHRFEAFTQTPPADSYPEPCAHCGYCHWQNICSAQWEEDDHLSLVANIRHAQIVKLELVTVETVAALATLPSGRHIPELNMEVLERLRFQAILQDHKRRTGENKVEVIGCEPDRSFNRLPKPDPGDLFFDMEGDPLHPDGLEYLFGLCLLKDGKLVFQAFWAHDHEEERTTFGQFMDFLNTHLTMNPGAFIYHYNHYETTALKRLAGRYAVAEHQLDDLLRRMKFVDLYKVVREAIRVSERAYSLKNLETFYMEKRDGTVATAGDSIVVYNRWRESGDDQLLQEIADYNEVDCISTARLRDWLLTLRPQSATWFAGPPAPPDSERAADIHANRQEREARYADYQKRLLESATQGGSEYRRRLADLLGFHAREGKPAWWEYFDRQSQLPDELLDNAECLAGLEMVGRPVPVQKSLLHTYRFPPQETKRRAGDTVHDVASLTYAGTIEELDEESLIVTIKRGAKTGPLPARLSVGPGGPIKSDVIREAIFRVADEVLAERDSYSAVKDLLAKALPRIGGRAAGAPIAPGEDLLHGTTEAVAGLEQSYLFIQGPPGSGKTYTSAHVIVELIRRGKKVGVAANSHKVVHNLLAKVEALAGEQKVTFTGSKKSSSGGDTVYNGPFIRSQDKKENISLDAQLLAGTAWLFSDERFDQQLDYLFIDEAGQVALANVVAMGTAARNIVLIGDQMQLGQPLKGVHPGDAGLSVLDFLLGGQATVSPERGIFLNHTWRLHPAVCQFISEAFYEGRLAPDPGNVKRRLIFQSPIDGITPLGIHFLPVTHSGCSQKSEEEGVVIKDYYQKLLRQKFEDKDGSVRPMTPEDILVVSPYNVQVNHLQSVLPAGARVGTVDKFQGQEAPVVLVSMATSGAEDMPRDIEFLFSANRLNVALSRAQCLAAVVASPKLLETPCRTINQLRLVNKFCRLAEYAAASHPTA